MKILHKCEICKKRKLIIRKRQVKIPTGITAVSQKQMCRGCYRKLLLALSSNEVQGSRDDITNNNSD